jgi:hypothetical protein
VETSHGAADEEGAQESFKAAVDLKQQAGAIVLSS